MVEDDQFSFHKRSDEVSHDLKSHGISNDQQETTQIGVIVLLDCDTMLLRHLGPFSSNNVSCTVQLASSGIVPAVVTIFRLGGLWFTPTRNRY